MAKTLKPKIFIESTDIVGGRALVSAVGVVDGTHVDVHLNESKDVWGTGIVADGSALVVGSPLPEQHSLTLNVHPVNTKLLPE